MKILKRILLIILGLILLPFIIAVFVPRSYTVTVTETINVPKQQVYEYVRLLGNQEEYSEWLKPDPEIHPEISGTDGTVGAIQKWDSENENVGEGEQEIIAVNENRMDVELRFIEPFEGKAKAAHIYKSLSENQTQITSEFYANEKYPMNLMSYTFGRSMVKKMETKNLANIKQILESRAN